MTLISFPPVGQPVSRIPADLEVEQALLGILMYDNAAHERISVPLSADHLYEPVHARLFATIEDLVEERGWEVRTRRAPPTALDAGQLNAISVSLFGFRDEVAIRVAGSPAGSTVDMRSVALSGFHDFGENGRRVEDLLLALDAQITLLLRNAPQAPAADLEIGENDDPGEAGEAVAAE